MKSNLNDSLISIITPAYNSEKYIKDCIESVINQTYTNWEMIIVNDCSNDQTLSIIHDYVKIDSRIKVITNIKNQGVANSRNTAVLNSKGRYISFLDADDIWYPKKLKTQINFMKRNDIAFSFASYELIDQNGKKINKIFKVPYQVSYSDYLKNTIIGCLTVMIDRKKIKDVRMPNHNLEDVITWMGILKNGNTAYGIQECLAEYRVSNKSASSNKLKNAMKYFNVLRKNQNLSLFKSIYCECFYLFNAIKKRLL